MSSPDPIEAQQHGQPQAEHGGHGTSVAAWTACFGVIGGSFVVALALILGSVAFAVVGAVVIVLAALAWPVLERVGLGAKSHNREITGEARAVR